MPDGNPVFPLGTDDQGRNLLTAMAYGLRTSIVVGILSVLIGLVVGGGLGLIAGFAGGKVDAFIMRAADVQLAYPALLLAMIIDGAARAVLGQDRDVVTAIAIVVLSIGIAFWVQYARTIRSSVMVERIRITFPPQGSPVGAISASFCCTFYRTSWLRCSSSPPSTSASPS